MALTWRINDGNEDGLRIRIANLIDMHIFLDLQRLA